jgi:hypothetical protein
MARACCTSTLHGTDVEAGVQPRVSAREAYPRRAEHNTIAEGGNRGWAETPSAERARSGQYLAEIGRDGIGGGHPTRKATKGFLGRRVSPARPPDRRCFMRKPNYRFERAERDRLRRAKKKEKAKGQQQERTSDQKSDEAGQPAPPAVSDNA